MGVLTSRATGNASAIATWRLRTGTGTAAAGTNDTTLIATANTNSFVDADVKVGDTVAITAGGGSGNSGTVLSIDSATQLTTSAITGMTTGSVFEIRRVPTDGDSFIITSTHVVTLDTNLGSAGGGGLHGIRLARASGETGSLSYDGETAADSYTIVIGSARNNSGDDVGTTSSVTYTPAGTPASTPGVTISTLSRRVQSETWTATCTTGGTGTSARFTVAGSVSGQQNTNRAPGTQYTADPDNDLNRCQFRYTIAQPGANGYQIGDTLVWTTTKPLMRGIAAGTQEAGSLSLVGTATRTVTIRPAVEDGTQNTYILHGSFNSAGSAGSLKLVYCTLRYLGSRSASAQNDHPIGLVTSVTGTVWVRDCTFTELVALRMYLVRDPSVLRNAFTPDETATGALVSIDAASTYSSGEFGWNRLLGVNGRNHWWALIATSTGAGASVHDNTMEHTGTNVNGPAGWRGLHLSGGTSDNRMAVYNNVVRPYALGTLALLNFPGGDPAWYGIDTKAGWFNFYDNIGSGYTLYEFEQNSNGLFYRNILFDGQWFIKAVTTRADWYNNIFVTRYQPKLGNASTEAFTDVRVYNNTVVCLGNASGALFNGGGSGAPANYQYYNNIVYSLEEIGTLGLQDLGPAAPNGHNVFTVDVDYNILFGFVTVSSTDGDSTNFGHPHPNTHEIVANPLLVSTTYGSSDLGKLQAGSPARAAGVVTADVEAIGTDFYGNPRIVDGAVSIGAVEYVALGDGGSVAVLRRRRRR